MSTIDLEATVQRLSHPDLMFETTWEKGIPFLRVVCPDGGNTSDPTKHFAWRGRKWRLSVHMTAGEVAQTALLASLAAAEHEMRELFKVDGVAVFTPHWDLEVLVAAHKEEPREEALQQDNVVRPFDVTAYSRSV